MKQFNLEYFKLSLLSAVPGRTCFLLFMDLYCNNFTFARMFEMLISFINVHKQQIFIYVSNTYNIIFGVTLAEHIGDVRGVAVESSHQLYANALLEQEKQILINIQSVQISLGFFTQLFKKIFLVRRATLISADERGGTLAPRPICSVVYRWCVEARRLSDAESSLGRHSVGKITMLHCCMSEFAMSDHYTTLLDTADAFHHQAE